MQISLEALCYLSIASLAMDGEMALWVCPLPKGNPEGGVLCFPSRVHPSCPGAGVALWGLVGVHSLVSLSGGDVVMCWRWIVGACGVLGWLVVVGPSGHLLTFHGVMTSKSGLGDPWARRASPAVGRAR